MSRMLVSANDVAMYWALVHAVVTRARMRAAGHHAALPWLQEIRPEIVTIPDRFRALEPKP